MLTDNNQNMAEQIAQVVSAMELQSEGHLPTAVTVILSNRTLVIALEGNLSTIEQDLLKTCAGAAQVQQFHQQLLSKPPMLLRQEIRRILGEEATEEAEQLPTNEDAEVKVFPNGTIVHVLLLARPAPMSAWSGSLDRQQLGKNIELTPVSESA